MKHNQSFVRLRKQSLQVFPTSQTTEFYCTIHGTCMPPLDGVSWQWQTPERMRAEGDIPWIKSVIRVLSALQYCWLVNRKSIWHAKPVCVLLKDSFGEYGSTWSNCTKLNSHRMLVCLLCNYQLRTCFPIAYWMSDIMVTALHTYHEPHKTNWPSGGYKDVTYRYQMWSRSAKNCGQA